MALLNFPPNPTTGDLFTIGTVVWQWNGYAWIRYNTVQITQTTTNISNIVVVSTNTNSTGTSSGALVVDGGVGVSGNLNIGGTSNIGGISRVTTTTESISTITGALIIDGGLAVGRNLHVGGTVNLSTGTIQIISMGSLDHASAPTSTIELGKTLTGASSVVQGGSISSLVGGSSSLKLSNNIASQHIDLTSYTLNDQLGITTEGLRLRVDGDSGDIKIFNTTSSTSTTTGALQVAGGVGIGGDVHVHGRVNSESLRLADAILDSTLVVTTASTSTVVIDSYGINQFRSAKYLVQIDEGTGPTDRCQVAEILLIVNNAGVVAATEYANLYPETDPALGEFYAGYDMFDGSVKLYFTPFDATVKEIVVLRTGLAV